MGKKAVPEGLSVSAAELWGQVTSKYVLRPDELRLLEQACRELALIDRLEAGINDESLLVPGSTGQLVINPLVSEVRQHRTAFKTLLAQLKLPDLEGDKRAAEVRSVQARKAAQSRWAVAHGKTG